MRLRAAAGLWSMRWFSPFEPDFGGEIKVIPTWTWAAGRSQVVKSFMSMIEPSTSGAFFLSFGLGF